MFGRAGTPNQIRQRTVRFREEFQRLRRPHRVLRAGSLYLVIAVFVLSVVTTDTFRHEPDWTDLVLVECEW